MEPRITRIWVSEDEQSEPTGRLPQYTSSLAGPVGHPIFYRGRLR
jgi:hypothetical protein